MDVLCVYYGSCMDVIWMSHGVLMCVTKRIPHGAPLDSTLMFFRFEWVLEQALLQAIWMCMFLDEAAIGNVATANAGWEYNAAVNKQVFTCSMLALM